LDFNNIAPYRDEEVSGAIRSLLEEMSFVKVLRFVYPEMDDKDIQSLCEGINTVKDFQAKVAYPAMKKMSDLTITSMTSGGFDALDGKKASLFISNHRDIILDSALLNMILHEHGLETTETAIGSNLLKDPTVRHLTKLNKNFTVRRDVTRKELYDTSLTLSSYIRNAITERNVSIWISQREGRAKDGNDLTQQGLLKMLAMSNGEDVIAGFKQLRIRPLALSYEYDPCDVYKLRELIKTQRGEEHVKEEDEDLKNIVAGISQPKGRVHVEVGPVLDEELNQVKSDIPVNDQVMQVARIIDRHIYAQAKLWPSNYIAADLLETAQSNAEHYTADELSAFHTYLEETIVKSELDDVATARQIFLKKYAYPLYNKRLAYEKQS
jgi:hypothetical protein